MTEPTRTTTQLLPEEWKTLCLLTVQNLYGFLQNIPSATETGAASISDQHLALIDGQIGRAASFLQAWRRSRVPGSIADAIHEQVTTPAAPVVNGAAEPKRRGGWPRGKPRKQPAATQ